VVYLYFLSYYGVAHHYLYDPGFLDESEKICVDEQKKSAKMVVG